MGEFFESFGVSRCFMMASLVGRALRCCGSQTTSAGCLKASSSTVTRSLTSSALRFNDQKTHTGQTWSEDDMRSMRYQDVNEKEVNKNWAIDMIKKVPVTMGRKAGGCLRRRRTSIHWAPKGLHQPRHARPGLLHLLWTQISAEGTSLRFQLKGQ